MSKSKFKSSSALKTHSGRYTASDEAKTASLFRQAFAEDHQILTQGLVELLDAVNNGDFKKAKTLAQDLNEKAGAHIQFEEEHLYPELVERRDPEFVGRLYHEHELAREAIEAIAYRTTDKPLQEEERNIITGKLQTALEHAYTCGSLLSYADHIEPKLQTALLNELHRCRVDNRRWSDLPRHGGPPLEPGAAAKNGQ